MEPLWNGGENDMENETLETAVNTWEKELNQKEKGSGYDLLTQIYGLKEVVCFLEKKYYGKEDELLQQRSPVNAGIGTKTCWHILISMTEERS